MSGTLAVNGIGEEPLTWDTMLGVSAATMLAAAVYGGLETLWLETECQIYDLNVSARAVNRCCSAANRQPPFFAMVAFGNAVVLTAILLYIRVNGQVQQLRQAIVNEKQLLHSMHDFLLKKKVEKKLELAGQGTGTEGGSETELLEDQAFTFYDAAPASQQNYVRFQVGVTYKPEYADRLNMALLAAFGLSVVAIAAVAMGRPGLLLSAPSDCKEYECFRCGLEQCFPANRIRTLTANATLFSSMEEEDSLRCHRNPESILPLLLMAIAYVLALIGACTFHNNCILNASINKKSE